MSDTQAAANPPAANSAAGVSLKRAALAAGGAAALALIVHAQTLVTDPIPRETPGLELSPVAAIDLGAGGAPLAWLAHAAVAALVTIIVLRLTGKLFAGLAAGLVFAGHPLTVEAVAWSEARAVPVGFALSLGAAALWFIVAEDARKSRARLLARIGAFALLAGSAVLHPMSAAAPVCLAAALSVMRRGSAKGSAAEGARRPLTWPMVAGALVALAVGTALHRSGVPPVSVAPTSATPALLFDSLISFFNFARLMPDYSALYTGTGTGAIVYGLVGLVLVFPVLERILRKRVPAARGALTWIAVALVLGIVVAGRGERHDWSLYLVGMGLAWFLGGVLGFLGRRADAIAQVGALVVLSGAFSAYSLVGQASAWRSPERVLMLMKRVPARAQLDFAERLIRMGGARERRASELDRRAKEFEQDKRDALARDLHEESSHLRVTATRLFRKCSSALMAAENVLPADDPRLLSTRGLVALRKKEYGRARKYLELAVDGMPPGPERAEVLVRLGGTWEGIGDRAEAVARYEQAARDAPEDPSPLVFLGMARRMSGEPKKALAALRRATELRPDDAKLQHRLGLIFMDMLMLKEAEAALLRAREADASNERCRDDLDTVRRLLKGQKDPGKARAAFAEGEMLEARATEALGEGDEGQATRMLVSAADAYRRAIAYAQHNHAAHYRRGVCLAMYGASVRKYDARRELLGEAADHFETALLYSPGKEDYLFALALALQDLGRTKDAEASYRRLLALNPSSARAHYQLAKLYAYQVNDPSRARDELAKALRVGLVPEPEFVENLEDIEYGVRTTKEREAEAAAQSASSEAEISLNVEGPAAAAAAYARAYAGLAGFRRPFIVRKRARAAAQTAACWEHAKDLAKALEWYKRAATLDSGPHDADVARVETLLSTMEAAPRE
jgi:tetratricopeptide (TPR) repeat protein